MRGLAGYAPLVTLTASLIALACAPKRLGLGEKCALGCTKGGPASFCASGTDTCEGALPVNCVGQIAHGGICTQGCVRDDDCRGGLVPMVCSGSCVSLERLCIQPEDAALFCKRTIPAISCEDLHLRGDGVCDGPSGTKHCADDAADCVSPSPWATACATSCAKVRAAACPLDDHTKCEEDCVKKVADPACRAEAKAEHDCLAQPEAHVCGDDQMGHDPGVCTAATAATSACKLAFYKT